MKNSENRTTYIIFIYLLLITTPRRYRHQTCSRYCSPNRLKGGELLKNCERLGAGIARVVLVIYKNVVYERLELCCKEENSQKIFGLK